MYICCKSMCIYCSTAELKTILPRIKTQLTCPKGRLRFIWMPVLYSILRLLTCSSQVSSHSYSQLRPIRGDGVPKLTSPTHKKPHDNNSGT